jgi:predicted nucleic acid-binding protein
MSAERSTYLDSSAIVKLAREEPESVALREYLRRRRSRTSSALARAEVPRALLTFGPAAVARGHEVLGEIDLIRINDAILRAAGRLQPFELRTLDAIHLATAQRLGEDLGRVCTYDDRMRDAAAQLGIIVVAPT